MDNQEIIQEVVDLDTEIERQLHQIEDIYEDIKADMVRRGDWLNKLQRNLNK